jgi:putative ABC transport system permease protein
VRASLGAGRVRLVRQLLTESLVLAFAGGVTGVIVAWLALDTIVANMPMRLSADAPVVLSLPVLAASLALTMVTGLLFGLVPAIRLSRVNLGSVGAPRSRRFGSALSRRGGQALIATEVALAIVLLAGAGLMIRSFARLVSTDVGFNPAAILTLEAWPVELADQHAYYPALVQKVRTLPGIEMAGAVDHVPLKGSSVVSGARLDSGRNVTLGIRTMLPGYLEAIGMPLRQGRLLTEQDLTGTPVAIINEAAARAIGTDGPVLGRRLERNKVSYEVVGIVGDVRHLQPSERPGPEIFLPFVPGANLALRTGGLTVVVRPRANVPELGELLRQAAASVGPRAIVGPVRSGDDWFRQQVVTPRRQTVLLGLLGGLGLVLTLVGILGVTAYAVARRTQEIGVRMAFGARPGQVVRQVTLDSAVPIGVGVAAGLIGAYFATRTIKSFLYETAPTDPATLAFVAAALTITAVLAAWIPARRAARVDPVVALRAE